MPTLNLQQLLSGDQISDMVAKINANFAQLATNGGGPQGSRGSQGPPGLPGLRGESGPAGDDGLDGQKVTIVNDDPQWGVDYVGNPAGTSDATAAIAAGYKEGDIWIDNTAGVFYDIHENPPASGVYQFVAHPISAAAISSGFWENDTDYSTGTDDANQGVKLSHRYATVSITSEAGDNTPTYDTSEYNLGTALGLGLTTRVYGYQRPGFKLSIDSRSALSIAPGDRINSTDTATEIYFNEGQGKMAPLLYLNSTETGGNGFGIFHGVLEGTAGKTNSLLSIRNPENVLADPVDSSILFLDVPNVISTSSHLSFTQNNNSDSEKSFSYMDLQRDGTKDADDLSLWLSMASLATEGEVFHAGNARYNSIGLRVKKYQTNSDTAISAYLHNRDNGTPGKLDPVNVSTDHVMSIVPDNVHITDDNAAKTTSSALVRQFKFAVEAANSSDGNERIALFRKNRLFGAQGATGLGIGAALDSGDYFPSLYGTLANSGFPTANWKPILLQPNDTLLPGTISPGYSYNNGDYSVGIGTSFASRFGVDGNFAIGQGSYQTISAPDFGGIIQGQLGVGRPTVLGDNQIQSSTDISIDNGFLGWNVYYDGGFKRTTVDPVSYIKQEQTGSASSDVLAFYADQIGNSGAPAFTPTVRMVIENQSGYVGINTDNPSQRLTIDTKGLIEGLQVLDSTAAMVGSSRGLQFRLDATNNAQIGFIDSTEATNIIEIFTAGEKRQRITGTDGRMRIQTKSTSINDPRGTASVDIGHNDDLDISSVSIGTFEDRVVDDLDTRQPGGYVGYNAEYDADGQVVTYHDRDGGGATDAAGSITFVDNNGNFHVAVYVEGTLPGKITPP